MNGISVRQFCFCFFLLFGLYKTATAQLSIGGAVKDSSSSPIAYATVLLYKDSTLISSTGTDSSGHYRLNDLASEKYKLSISRIGFIDLDMSFHLIRDTVISSQLQRDSTVVLNTFVVDGSGIERTADRFIYTPDRNLAEGSSAIELMRHVPMIIYDERNDAFSLVGKSGTMVYINNRKTEIPGQMLAQILRAMPASNIISIDLITDPGSEYTANTTGGVININLKRELHEGWLGSVSYIFQQGPYAKSILNSYLNYRKGKFGVQITPTITSDYNFFKSISQLIYNNDDKDSIRSTYYRRYHVIGNGLKLDYDINDKNFISYNGWLSVVSGRSNRDNLTYYRTGNTDTDFLSKMAMTGKDNFIYNYGNINYRRTIDSEDNYLDLSIDYNHFFQRRKNSWSFDESDNYQNNLPQQFLNLSGRIEYSKPFKADLTFLTGLQISSTSTDNNQRYFTGTSGRFMVDTVRSVHYQYDEKYYAGFISFSKKINDHWSIKTGLRLELLNYITREILDKISADSSYVTLFPDVSASYRLNNNNQFSLSYAKKITRPNIELLFPGRTYMSKNYFTQNNPFLQPSFRNRLDLSYTLRSKYVLRAFYSVSRNNYASFVLPVEEEGATMYRSSYYNYRKVKSFGVAFNGQHTFFKDFWKLYYSSWYDFDRYLGETPNIPIKVINHSYGLYINNQFNLSEKYNWIAFVTFNYRSPINNISGKRLNPMSSLDFQIKKVIKRFSFNLIFSNIYNGSSIERYMQYANNNLKENLQEYNSYNRSVLIRATYSFGNNRVKGVKNRSSANDEIRNRVN